MRGHILQKAKDVTMGDRNKTHGEVTVNMDNVAMLWNAYLRMIEYNREVSGLRGSDVAMLMSLMKIARTFTGAFNDDDFIDGAAYIAIAGECADLEAGQASLQAAVAEDQR